MFAWLDGLEEVLMGLTDCSRASKGRVPKIIYSLALKDFLGYVTAEGNIVVKAGLPDKIRRHVILHEKTHLENPTSSELKIIFTAAIKDPVGALVTTVYHIRRKTYKGRHPFKVLLTFQKPKPKEKHV